MTERVAQKNPTTLEEVEREINDLYLIKDKGVIRIILAAVIANILGISAKPVWLLLLAGSSGGKTVLLQLLDGLKEYIMPIDELTVNTMASGYKGSREEVSLLHKANGLILVFKDFTTLLSMNKENLRTVMGQFRAIYDGSYEKKTGNAGDVSWAGKIGIIAGGTTSVQRLMRQYTDQGERFINYLIEQPDPIEMTTRAIFNRKNIKEKEESIKNNVADWVRGTLASASRENFDIPEDIQKEMILIANFSTLARSPVKMNFKDEEVEFVPEREMPARMATMLTNLALTFIIMNPEGVLAPADATILYKCALDSIPSDRRLILRLLTQYKTGSTKSLAVALNYPTNPVRNWCSQLTALGMLVRRAKGEGSSDTWTLLDEWREIMHKYEGIEMKEVALTVTEEEELKMDNLSAERDQELMKKILENDKADAIFDSL